jgi:hypothetical protein
MVMAKEKAKIKELKVGEMLKVAKGGVLVLNTKSGVIINLPEKAAARAIEKSPVLEAFVGCPSETCGSEVCGSEICTSVGCADESGGCGGEIVICGTEY